MNSSRPIPVEQPLVNWLEKAKRKFVGATIHNSGQFAVAVMDHVNIYLFSDRKGAEDFCIGHPAYRISDLDPPVQKTHFGCANIKSQSDYEDRLWERRQQRQAPAEA